MKSAHVKKRVLEELRKTPIVEVACGKAGIGRTAFYDWKKKDQKFARAVDLAAMSGRDFISDVAEGQLLNAIKSGDIRAISLWLKTHRAAYRNRLVIEDELTHEFTSEQKALVVEALRRMADMRAERLEIDDKKSGQDHGQQ